MFKLNSNLIALVQLKLDFKRKIILLASKFEPNHVFFSVVKKVKKSSFHCKNDVRVCVNFCQ